MSNQTPSMPVAHEPGIAVCGACCTRLNDFGVRIGGVTILQAVNLHLHCGELAVVIGPNGAGKTTLLQAILGELPHSGRLDFAAESGIRNPRIGYVPQRMDFDRQAPFSVMDLFAAATRWRPVFTGVGAACRRDALTALEQVGAADLADHRVGSLSGGQLQRVMLAMALTPVPNLLLLDEPVTGMDQSGIDLFYHTVSDLRAKYDLSILMVSHDLPMAAHVADRMIFINRTVIADGVPDIVLKHPEVRRIFGAHGLLPNYGSLLEASLVPVAHHAPPTGDGEG